ncbi:hypothetical protein BJY52DRAFT_1302567, partial [Lactarius psammicola]
MASIELVKVLSSRDLGVADLTTFMTQHRMDAVGATFTVERVNGGGYDSSRPTTEANLNIQYAQAMAYTTPHVFYLAPTNQPRPTCGWSGSATCSTSRRSRRQSVLCMVSPRKFPARICNSLVQSVRPTRCAWCQHHLPKRQPGRRNGDCKANDSGRVQFIPFPLHH